MHENIRVAVFSVDDAFQITGVVLSKNSETLRHLPIGVTDCSSLKVWLLNRGVPVTRQRLKVDLNGLKVKSPFELMLSNYGLSLTDHYWVCRQCDNYTWETINLYKNNFKSTYSLDLRSDKRSIAGKTNFTPSSSLKGDLKKKWIIDNNNTRRLVKGNYNNTCRQSLCEVLATQIHKNQGKISYTPYSLIKISSDNQLITGCECPNFTSIDTEFVSAIDIVDNFKKPNDISYYEFFIQLCNINGLDIRFFLEYQIMTDFIISNSDRHFNNFGIIRRSDNLQWLSYAPLFDSGNSMFYKSDYIPVDKALLKLQVTSFLSKEVNLLSYVTNRGLVDIRLLPDDNYLFNLLRKDVSIKDEVNERLVKAYNKKIKYFIDFQNGADIWSYNYKG
jgi:hypothetical protein